VFIAIDNGASPLADTATTILSFSDSLEQKPVIKITGNCSIHPLETCSLTIVASDADSGKTVTVSMSGYPDGVQLIDGKYFLWTAHSLSDITSLLL